VQFLVEELVITFHTTYPKIRYRGLKDFEISQIYVFHISIFHAKNINSLGEYNKSCSAPHQESRKIEFAIF
jgi:hypothetical protein